MQKGMIFLGISLLSVLFSLATTILLLSTLEFGMSTDDFLWRPIIGSFIGLIFGILASANLVESKRNRIVYAAIVINLVFLAISLFLRYVLPQLAA
jgi:uncharacterized membrane protein YfcA